MDRFNMFFCGRGLSDKTDLLMGKKISSILFGLIFGFLLQRGGVSKYHILEGQLLLTDFTVMKVILSAITVAMIGIMILHMFGKIKIKIKPTQVLANITGGLIFGVGFAFSGFCPGTGAAALGQGDLGAFFYVGGMLVGSYFYAELSLLISQSIQKIGDLGKITIPEIINVQRNYFVNFFAVFLVAFLFLSSVYLK